MEPVRHHRNPRVVEAARLHRARERTRRNLTLIEGPSVLGEALAAGISAHVAFGLESDVTGAGLCASHGIEWVPVTADSLKRLSGTQTPRGPVAVISIPTVQQWQGERSALVAWGVSDPGNVGTMVRTAAAFGWDFAFTPGTADPWSPKAVRAGAGAHFRTVLHPVTNLEGLRDARLTTLATVVSGGVDPNAVEPGRFAVLIGEEAHGLPDDVVRKCEIKVTIVLPGGSESLNASAAAAIVVYAFTGRDRP